jgi:hypothetical protein
MSQLYPRALGLLVPSSSNWSYIATDCQSALYLHITLLHYYTYIYLQYITIFSCKGLSRYWNVPEMYRYQTAFMNPVPTHSLSHNLTSNSWDETPPMRRNWVTSVQFEVNLSLPCRSRTQVVATIPATTNYLGGPSTWPRTWILADPFHTYIHTLQQWHTKGIVVKVTECRSNYITRVLLFREYSSQATTSTTVFIFFVIPFYLQSVPVHSANCV